MRCDTLRELIDDLDGGRLSPSLDAEFTEHLSGCDPCAAVLERHRAVVAALKDLPAPVLPRGLDATLARRLRSEDDGASIGSRLAVLWLPALRYAASAAAAGALTVTVLYATGVSFTSDEVPPARQPETSMPVTSVKSVCPGSEARQCLVSLPEAAAEGLNVVEGDEVEVTLSVQTPEPWEGAKVYVVLPRGLMTARDEDSGATDRRVLTFHEDILDGTRDFGFKVRGTKVGRWDVWAVVEGGDSTILEAGTTIVVGPKKEEL